MAVPAVIALTGHSTLWAKAAVLKAIVSVKEMLWVCDQLTVLQLPNVPMLI
jgi:hypothetical protein